MVVRKPMLAGLSTGRIVATFTGTLVPLIAVIVALAIYGDDLVGRGTLTRPALYVAKDYLYAGVIAAGVYLLGVRASPASWAAIGFRRCGIDWIVKAVLLAILLYWVHIVVNTAWAAAGYETWASLPRDMDVAMVRTGSPVTRFTLAIAVAFATPVVVEIFARGIVFAWLRRNLDFWLSAIASSIVFGVIHIEVVKYGQAAVFGIVAAYLYDRSKSLWPAIALHVAINAAYMIGVLELGLLS